MVGSDPESEAMSSPEATRKCLLPTLHRPVTMWGLDLTEYSESRTGHPLGA